ncbi:MAG: sodium-dependent bicarbonate transport family permease [Turneriella sp.]|nr:sodium-dependent bicarbonate transport family permease [Turneriella sp.]
MDILHVLWLNLQTPMILAFLLGIIATLLKSDLRFPDGMYTGLTIYLLLAIGLKGGVKLSLAPLSQVWLPALMAFALCIVIPVAAFVILRNLGKFDAVNAAAIAAHYGSVSAVTFSEAQAFLDSQGIAYEGFMPSLLALMEIPAIMVALFLVRARGHKGAGLGNTAHELFAGKGTLLLVGGLAIGLISGKKGFEQFAPLFDTPFRGVLVLFLLEVGIVTGRRLADLKHAGIFLVLFGILFPLLSAAAALPLAKLCGLSYGGAMIFATLAASASYIAAPSAIRLALPEASPAYYLTASLAITFPFNVAVGLPLYLTAARTLYGV